MGFGRVCGSCSGTGTEIDVKGLGPKMKFGNLKHMLRKSVSWDPKEVNCTNMFPARNPKLTRFHIDDMEELCWQSMVRPQKCAFLNIAGPQVSIFVIDSEADSDTAFIDPLVSYDGKPPLLQTFREAFFEATGLDSHVVVLTASGIKPPGILRTSFHTYFSDLFFSDKQREMLLFFVRKKVKDIYGDFINGVSTAKLCDRSFHARFQHSRAPYSDRETDGVANNRLLVPYAVAFGNEVSKDACWMCTMKKINLFTPRPVAQVGFDVQCAVRMEMVKEAMDRNTSLPNGRHIAMGRKWEESDPRFPALVKKMLGLVGNAHRKTGTPFQIKDVYDRLDGSVKGFIAAPFSSCPFVPKGYHETERTIFIIREKAITVTDFECRTKDLFMRYETEGNRFFLTGKREPPPPEREEEKEEIPDLKTRFQPEIDAVRKRCKGIQEVAKLLAKRPVRVLVAVREDWLAKRIAKELNLVLERVSAPIPKSLYEDHVYVCDSYFRSRFPSHKLLVEV
jgi:hypothetical protein